MTKTYLWREALAQSVVWRKALKFGLTAGILQAAMNQGNAWWQGAFTAEVVIKSILSPLVGLAVGLLAAGATYVENQMKKGTDHVKV